MITLDSTSHVITQTDDSDPIDQAERSAVAFLVRYSGRTLDGCRHDLRVLFQRASEHGLPLLTATRAHLELNRTSMEERGLAACPIRCC